MKNGQNLKFLSILIPTYNRAQDLLINLNHLYNEINRDDLVNEVCIIISDNFSADNTRELVEHFIAKHQDLQIIYKCQNENIGLERNAVSVFEYASSPYVMFIGDDDLVGKGYLRFCIGQIQGNSYIGCVIPGIKSVNRSGEEKVGRVENYEFKIIEKGYDAVYYYSHMGHQMSGLVIKSGKVLHAYLSKPEYRNPYLFIYFTAYCLYNHRSIYAPMFKTAVQIDNEKDWGYNEIGLLDEVFKSYYYFIGEMADEQIANILIHFVRMHSYRLEIHARNPFVLLQKGYRLSTIGGHIKGFKRKLAILLVKEYFLKILN